MGLFSIFSNKAVNSGGYTSKTYKLKNMKLIIKAENVDAPGTKVYIQLFTRPIPLYGGTVEATSRQMADTTEFFADVEGLISFMHKSPELGKQSSYDALKNSCTKHIQQYGRLIDTDLDMYLYCLMHIVNAVDVACIGKNFDVNKGAALFQEMKEAMYETFPRYIFVNRYNPLSPNPFDKYELVPLSELR
ncbi:hypothetical protein BXP70_25730 [Hymenobacter crusticola]|uniref:Uncharacterized protein n=2 Tax=Hymenobacter crusticola TaxID=1770526 RepID=A0A243W814_9BACT|nr:hypothetical protein BXP70_25730 [Hymenobacter crusticola]